MDNINENIDLEEEYEQEDEYIRTTDLKENAIEWYNGQDTITLTLSQKKFINKINRLAKEYPNEVKIDKINDDGTILAHIPLKYLRITKPREFTEEEKLKAKERLLSYKK